MSTNPRGRDMLTVTPAAKRGAQLPGIPPASTPFERAVKGWIDARNNGANVFQRFATVGDLQDLGLRGGVAEGKTPGDALAVPVWTSRGRFVPVTLSALATSLSELLTITSGTDADGLASLRRKIAQTEPGITEKRATLLIQQAVRKLSFQLQTEILKATGGGVDYSAQIAEAQRLARKALQLALSSRDGLTVTVGTAAAVWTITHDMGRYPQVLVMNADDEKIEPDVEFTSLNVVTITHGRAVAGRAILT